MQGTVLDVSEVNIWALLQRIIHTSNRKAACFIVKKKKGNDLSFVEEMSVFSVGPTVLPSAITPCEGQAFNNSSDEYSLSSSLCE